MKLQERECKTINCENEVNMDGYKREGKSQWQRKRKRVGGREEGRQHAWEEKQKWLREKKNGQ